MMEHLVESTDDEQDLANLLSVDDDILSGRGRQEKSLGNLATKFANLLRNSPDGVMHLSKASKSMRSSSKQIENERRFYVKVAFEIRNYGLPGNLLAEECWVFRLNYLAIV